MEGATLKFIPDPAKYLPVVFTRFEGTECMNYSPLIYAFEQENIAVTGKGTLDGSASNENWWAWKRSAPTPSAVCSNSMTRARRSPSASSARATSCGPISFNPIAAATS